MKKEIFSWLSSSEGKRAVLKNQLNVTFDLITGNWASRKGGINSIWEGQSIRKVFIEEKI